MSDRMKDLEAKLQSMGFNTERLKHQVKDWADKNHERAQKFVNGDDSVVELSELTDFDITAELKRRLAAKKLSKDLDCECKSLTDAEMVVAVQTAHDIRTGKLDPKDIESPIDIHPRLVEAAVCAPSTGDTPYSMFRKQTTESYKVIEEDLKISKKVVESLVEKKIVSQHQDDEARRILGEALNRQRDKEVVFVPVSGLEPRVAAQRVINLKSEYDEVEPVDLSHVFDDVNPLTDLHIEKLQHLMNVKKAIDLDGVPDEIRFVIPNIDLPAPFETDPSDMKFAMVRYVHFDSMPKEIQRVVRTYLTLKSGTDLTGKFAQKSFKEAVAELAKRAEATFDDESKDE